MNSDSHVFQLYKEDGSVWMNLHLATFNRNMVKMSEVVRLLYDDPATEEEEANIDVFTDNVVSIVPRSW